MTENGGNGEKWGAATLSTHANPIRNSIAVEDHSIAVLATNKCPIPVVGLLRVVVVVVVELLMVVAVVVVLVLVLGLPTPGVDSDHRQFA